MIDVTKRQVYFLKPAKFEKQDYARAFDPKEATNRKWFEGLAGIVHSKRKIDFIDMDKKKCISSKKEKFSTLGGITNHEPPVIVVCV